LVRIAISVEAFEAIARTLPLGSVAVEAEPNERGERLIWLEAAMVDRLGAMRGPGETYSDATSTRPSIRTPATACGSKLQPAGIHRRK
jgi:hypothetical protein